MKFKTNGEQFSSALAKLSPVIPSRTTLPLLENILFRLNGNNLQMLATDNDAFIRTSLEVEGKEDGEITIPAKPLLEVCRTFMNIKISINIDEKNRMVIKSPNSKHVIAGEQIADFPVPNEITGAREMFLEGDVFRKYINKVLHSVNKDEIRRNMSGVLFDIRLNEIRFVATDGFRLSKVIKENFENKSGQEDKFIVPSKVCSMILRLNNNEDSKLLYDQNILQILFGNVEIFSKLIDETFPNYETVIPQDNNKRLNISKKAFKAALERALIFSDVITRRVRLEMTNKMMTVRADNPELGREGEETLECSLIDESDSADKDFDKEPFVIAFNSHYLLECIEHMESDEINISFREPSKAAIIKPSEKNKDEDFMELIMPIRVS